MEIVLIGTGIVALVALVALTLRRRSVRRSAAARQWRGSAGVRPRATHAAAVAGPAGGSVAFAEMGGGTAVQDPPRTLAGDEPDLDAWDDDLEWTDDLDASPPPAEPPVEPRFDRPAPAPAAPAPVAEPPAPAPAADRAPAAATPDPAPAEEDGAWDDGFDSYGGARPDGVRSPFPEPRGAAAFGAATATPPAPRSARRRGGPLRSPVVLVALYAATGIALVVLAVSLLSEGVSPSDPEPARPAAETSRPTPEPPPAVPADPAEAEKAAAAVKARARAAFRRAHRSAVLAQRRAVASARQARQRRLRAAARRRAERRREGRASRAAPNGRVIPPAYRPAPAQPPAPPAPPPAPSGGGGGGTCEFCIG